MKEFQVVIYVCEQETVMMSEIAEKMKIPMSTATGIVDKLVAKNYLQRKLSPSERSIVLIESDLHARRRCFNALYVRKCDIYPVWFLDAGDA